jgi:glycosyltransferase involved in cell wall biosynthesis
MNTLPRISVVTPTKNSAKTLGACLASIRAQDYPQQKIEMIIVDGASEDQTLTLAKRYRAKILENPLQTGEAGKAVGVKAAQGELIALIDSDNILPTRDWLRRMIAPFAAPAVLAAEPIRYTRRGEDSDFTRYTAMLGMSDPLVLFLGNYDRECLLTGKWTEMPYRALDAGDWLAIEFEPHELPTIGANGTLVRAAELKKMLGEREYLFDLDLIYELLLKKKWKIAKVKVGIVHIFSGDARTFARKQLRRVRDYVYYSGLGVRTYPWHAPTARLALFALATITTVPTLWQALRGAVKSKDTAWFLHPLACWITLVTYSWGRISATFSEGPLSRKGWKQ